MTWIASSSARIDSPGPRRGPPIATMASQKAPAPSPSSNRPPLSRSSVAAALASIAGGRIGSDATSGKTETWWVVTAIAVSSVQVSWNRRW